MKRDDSTVTKRAQGATAQEDNAAARSKIRRRFVIEGEWSGYTSSQRRVVHRQVYAASFKQLRAWAEKTHAISYTDGTMLCITVRDCKPRERVKEIKGYSSLIADCAYHDVSAVSDLPGHL